MIEDLMVLLGLPEEIDEELENKLLLILKATKQRLRFLLGGVRASGRDELYHSGCVNHTVQQNRFGRAFLSQC